MKNPELQRPYIEQLQWELKVYREANEKLLAENEKFRHGIADILRKGPSGAPREKHLKCRHDRFQWEDCGSCVENDLETMLGLERYYQAEDWRRLIRDGIFFIEACLGDKGSWPHAEDWVARAKGVLKWPKMN